MPTVVGVRLPYAGKTLYFDPAATGAVLGDHVVVSTERGQEFGQVVSAPAEVDAADLPAALKPVLRVASEDDIQRVESYDARAKDEMRMFRRLVSKHALDMKPIGVQHLFDDSKVVFYFVAEERVDFRDLVRELASEFHARIDMRQVGVRDEARMVGGLGHCGQQLCCARFGGDFQPVSIRMAKEQDLPLNPLKISGLCGRLMCCLRYEYEAYKDFKQRAPKCGTPVEMPTGQGKVVTLNTPKEQVTIRTGDGSQVTVPLEALDCSAGRGCPCKLNAEALPDFEPAPVSVVPLAEKSVPSAGAEAAAPAFKSRRSRRPRKRKPAGEASGGQENKQQQQGAKQGGEGQKKSRPPKQQNSQPKNDKPAGQAASTSDRRRRRRSPGSGSQEKKAE